MSSNDPIFEPLRVGRHTFKNRLFRSSISGRIDNYNGSGTPTRVRFEEQFAAGGVGAIISSHVPIRIDSRVLPNYATIDCDERIPFWRTVGRRVHAHDCKYILQLSMSGRQQDIGGVENLRDILNRPRRFPPSATDEPDHFNGLPCRKMDIGEVEQAVSDFATAAARAVDAGLDGVELHSSNGYLINQFLSRAINKRTDRYGGDIVGVGHEGRATFVCDIIRAIRKKVGRDVFLSMKLSVVELDNATLPWPLNLLYSAGNETEESIRVARLVEAAGADVIHVSTGSMFPHPRNPAGPFPVEMAWHPYQAVIGSGTARTLGVNRTFFNYLVLRYPLLHFLMRLGWARTQRDFLDANGQAIPGRVEGLNLPEARAIKEAVEIPVICTGGFQTAAGILGALQSGACDAVSMARPLLANPSLPRTLLAGAAGPERPCSYCNRCLLNVLEHPLGCYDLDRFASYDEMIKTLMSIFPDKLEVPNSPDSGWL